MSKVKKFKIKMPDGTYSEYVDLAVDAKNVDTANGPLDTALSKIDTTLKGLHKVATSGDYKDLINTPTEVSAFANDVGYLTEESDPTVPGYVKAISEEDIESWNNKSEFDGKYSSLIGTPTLSKVATSGKYTDLIGVPTLLSQFTNDTNFIDNTISNLTNYYLKKDIYTKAEVNKLISDIHTLDMQIVDVLPEQPSSTTIYLIKKAGTTEEQHIYEQYLWSNGEWHLIGETGVDLSNYYNKTQVDTLLEAKTETKDFNTHTSNQSIHVSVADRASWNAKSDFDGSYTSLIDTPTLAEVATSGNYSDLNGTPKIPAAVAIKVGSSTEYKTGNIDITKATIGLGNVDNTQDSVKKVASAATLTTPRHINGIAFDGSKDINIGVTAENVSGLATVATSGSYTDLTNTPTFPDESTFVKLAGTQIITGAKTFSSDATFKKYIILSALADYGTGTTQLYYNGTTKTIEAYQGATDIGLNAKTATKLKTAVNIAGVAFDGSQNINISYKNLTDKPTIPSTTDCVKTSGDQTISGVKTFENDVILSSMTLNKHKVTSIKSLSSNGNLDWTTTAAGQATLIDESCLAFWNGAHTGSSSNLTYSKYGTIMGLSSAQTVTGIKTFNVLPESSVVPTKDTQLTNKTYVDTKVSFIKATDEADALAKSKTDTKNVYYW